MLSRTTWFLLSAIGMTLGLTGVARAGTVVQFRQPGPRLIAQRWDSSGTSQTLTLVAQRDVDWSTMTLLDLDRDGTVDALVSEAWNPSSQKVDWRLFTVAPRATADALTLPGRTCFVPESGDNVTRVAQGSIPEARRANTWATSLTADFSAQLGDLARYDPVITTVYAPQAGGIYGTSEYDVGDYLPNSADPSTSPSSDDRRCSGAVTPGTYGTGFLVAPARGTGRGEATADPARVQKMTSGSSPGPSVTQLGEAAIEQWTGDQTTTDLTADIPNPTYTTDHPASLRLGFVPGRPVDSVTYLTPDGGKQPLGLVTTSASSAPGMIHVALHTGLAALSYVDGATGNGCYPRSATSRVPNGAGGTTAWGGTPLSFDVPLTPSAQPDGSTLDEADVSLDQVLGIGTGGTADRAAFRWAATTAPGSNFQPQYVPDVIGRSGGAALGPCSVPTTGNPAGTQLLPAQMVRMATSLPTAALSYSPSNPVANSTVTLTATTGATNPRYFFDPESDGTYDAGSTSATRTHAYPATPSGGHPRAAGVYVTDAAGTGQMASVPVATDDAPPTASFTAGTADPYLITNDLAAATTTWTDTSHDSDGTIASRSWDLHLTNGNGSEAIHCTSRADGTSTGGDCAGAAFNHTWTPGQQGDWVLFLTVTDDAGATDTTFHTMHVVAPPVANIASITPNPVQMDISVFPPRAPFQLHAQTADDGTLGSDGPLSYAWAIGGRAGVNPPFADSDFLTQGNGFSPDDSDAFQVTGTYTAQLRVTDTASRVARSPIKTIYVRAAGDDAPVAALQATPGQAASAETDVLLDASASYLKNADGTQSKAWSFVYDFGDGTPPLTTTDDAVHHTYAGSGDYTASVVAFDDRVAADTPSDPATAAVHVIPGATDANAPVAALARTGAAGPVFANRAVTLSATGSRVVTAPAHFGWDLDGDGTFETDSGTQATLSTTFPSAGTRNVRVRVTDGFGRVAVSAPVTIVVAPEPNLAPSVALAAADTVTLTGGRVVVPLDASASTGRNPDPSLTFAWDLDGDGVYETPAPSTTSVTFTTPGDHTVRVRATDAYGNVGVQSKTIYVRGAADIAAGCRNGEQYRNVTYGNVDVAACWTRADRPDAGPLWFARTDATIDGMVLSAGSGDAGVPVQSFSDCTGACADAAKTFNTLSLGTRIALDPSNGHLVSNGPVAWKATSGDHAFVLNDGPLDEMLPGSSSKDGIELAPPKGVSFLTLSVANEAEVKFPAPGDATIGLSVHMPPQMTGANGDITLLSNDTTGLQLDNLKIVAQVGMLAAKLTMAKMELEYDRDEDQWSGGAELKIPGIKERPTFGLGVTVVVKDGRFKSIYGQAEGLEIDLGEGIFLQNIRAGVGVDPLDLRGGLGISAGPKIGDLSILSSDGDLRVTFPSAAAPYTLFQIAGVTKLLDTFVMSQAVVRFTTDGFVEARGGMSRQSFIGYFDADVGGWFTLHDFELSGNAEVGLLLLGDKLKLAGGKVVVSKQGVAACGEIPVLNVAGGIGYHWGGSFDTFNGCDLGPYGAVRPSDIPSGFGVTGSAAAFKAPVVDLAGGLRSAGITIHGRGGAPQVQLVDHAGHVVLDATKEQLTKQALVQFDAQQDVTQILWKAPAKGRYVVRAAPGSVPLGQIASAVDRGAEHVRTTVSGTGAKRSLRWSVTPALQRGQQLVLSEQLPDGGSLVAGQGRAGGGGAGSAIVTTTKSKGTMSFVPQPGHGEARVVSATILTDGLGRPPVVAGRFTAPRPVTPPRPAGVTLRRAGRTVTLSWAEPRTGAPSQWQVSLQAGTARSTLQRLPGKTHVLRMTEVNGSLPVRARVTGLTSGAIAGPAATASLRPGAPRSGGSAAADTRPRGLTARRSGTRLVLRWRRGPELARGFAVTVRIGKRTVRLSTAADRPTATVKGLPKARTLVRAEVVAQRLDGRRGTPVTLAGPR